MKNDIDIIELHGENILENPQEQFNQLDHRGFNLLMIAAENGRNDEIVRLLNLGFDVISSIGPHTAASLAYQRHHYDSLLILLNANSKFPSNFNAEATQHAGLIEFDALMNQFHEHLFSEELTELQNIINSHRHLQYFFNSGGHSAAFEALNNMIINCYELFVRNNILLSPDEDFNEAISSLTDDQKEQVRVIHERHAVPLPNNHLMIIHGCLFVGHDINEADRIHRLNTAQNAINFLNEIPQIEPILKLIARAGGFKIIFDFNRENVQFMAPKSNEGSRGLFCTTRHIYIAARNLLNDDNQVEVFGTMAHELCHFAMDLTYNNNCKPYNEADRETIGQEFHQILLQSRQQQNVGEDIVNAVWNYPDEVQFAELIVRVPHMMAFYANNQPILYLRSQQFQPLFNSFTTRVLPDINNKIPTINAEMNQMRANFYDQTLKKVSKWRKTAKIVLGFAPIGIIIAALLTYYIVFMPNISYYELSPEDQLKVVNGNVKFFNVNLKFNELFNEENTQLLNSLNSIQLWTLIDGETLDLDDQRNKKLQDEIFLIYANMTDSLKQKLKDGKVSFQGKILTIKQMIGNDENSEIYSKLNVYQVRELLTGNLKIGKIQQIKRKFYVERNFIDYKINKLYYNYEWNRKQNFHQISSIAYFKKMILLSDKAGAGKTTAFKHIAVKLKEKYPDYWISYIDLKRHLKVYEKFEQIIQPIEVLKKILSITDEFEVEIFTKLFNSDKVILLYDGVDEIAPKFKNFFINLIANVKNSTKNQQWMATRPQHTQELMTQFNLGAYKLVEYDGEKKIEFVRNVLKNLNAEDVDAKEIINNINKIYLLNSLDTPLMLQMMTELYVNNKTIIDNSNTFSLYDKMIEMKMELLDKKGKIVNRDRDKRKAKMTIWEIHHIYALKLLFKDGFVDYFNENRTIDINEFQLLKRWKKEQSKWTPEAISRYGLLIVDDWNTEREFPDFVHRTFAEFLVAQFLIEDLYDLDEDNDVMSEMEVELRAKLLIDIVGNAANNIRSFLQSFTDSHKSKKMHKYFTKIITGNEMQNFLSSKTNIQFIDLCLVEIMSIDVRFLKKFRFNDEKTIFQALLNKRHFTESIHECLTVYERSLGENWIHYTGYSLKENYSLARDDEINEILSQDFDEPYDLFRDNSKKSFRVFYKLFCFLTQAKMPQDDVLNFFNSYGTEILDSSFHSSILISKLWKIIQTYFNDSRVELVKLLNDIKYLWLGHSSEKKIANAVEFFKKLEQFLRVNETINVYDIRFSIVNYYTSFYRMKKIIELHSERNLLFDNKYSYEEFSKKNFGNGIEEGQLLDMRDENNHTVFTYLDELISDKNVETDKILIMTKDFLIKLAKKNGMSDYDINILLE